MNLLCRSVPAAAATMVLILSAIGCDAARRVEKAQAQVRRIAADLDQRTTKTGVYVRAKAGEIKEQDPWGTPIQVDYSQGGVAEMVTVCSAGPDREFHTQDDVIAYGMAANLKGIGEGIKNNVEETAANAAKGLVKGTVDGVKESVKGAMSFKKKKDGNPPTQAEEAREETPPESENSDE